MTPLEIPAFMTGTVAGMTVWGCVYASIGGASRSLLKSGMDLEEVVNGRQICLYDRLHCQQLIRVSWAHDCFIAKSVQLYSQLLSV